MSPKEFPIEDTKIASGNVNASTNGIIYGLKSIRFFFWVSIISEAVPRLKKPVSYSATES